MANRSKGEILLEVRNLRTYFFTEAGVIKAVDGVDLTVHAGEVLGLVGESGCGKSVTSLSIMRLIGHPGEIVNGEVHFAGHDLIKLPEKKLEDIRGNHISMIFQQPISSLNPIYTIGYQVAEVLQIHENLKKKEAWKRTVELLRNVGISDPDRKSKAFPHELSGGQAQRVMIAMALATMPELLIADEPTTALDVTIQAQILDLLRDLRAKFGTTVIFITHDLGVVSEIADRVAVMYAGQIVEEADVATLFDDPKHPYTVGLIDCIPILGQVREWLTVIPGAVPNLIDLPPGCRFAPRCQARVKFDLSICTEEEPDIVKVGKNHTVRCFLYESRDEHKAPLSVVTTRKKQV